MLYVVLDSKLSPKRKNDRSDAAKLAKQLIPGEVSSVHVLSVGVCSWRELNTRCRHSIDKRTTIEKGVDRGS